MADREYRIEKTDFGYWIYPRDQRARFVAHGSATAKKIEAGAAMTELFRARRSQKEGSIEPITYYRDEEGNIGIPPEPDLLPDGVTPQYATTLGELDSLAKEMQQKHYADWQDHGEFTEMMEQHLDNPRKALISQMMNPKSEMERDVIRILLEDLDREESNRQKISSNVFFHHREYER